MYDEGNVETLKDQGNGVAHGVLKYSDATSLKCQSGKSGSDVEEMKSSNESARPTKLSTSSRAVALVDSGGGVSSRRSRARHAGPLISYTRSAEYEMAAMRHIARIMGRVEVRSACPVRPSGPMGQAGCPAAKTRDWLRSCRTRRLNNRRNVHAALHGERAKKATKENRQTEWRVKG
jgi:hypothetical protein